MKYAYYWTQKFLYFLIDRYKEKPLRFQLGWGNVIKALDMGLLDMCVGEKRVIIAPAILAYGRWGKRKCNTYSNSKVRVASGDIELIKTLGYLFSDRVCYKFYQKSR